MNCPQCKKAGLKFEEDYDEDNEGNIVNTSSINVECGGCKYYNHLNLMDMVKILYKNGLVQEQQ